MIDSMYSIKEASKMLDCSTQNIYRQKQQLIDRGLMEQSETGAFFINEKGLNYLREKRIETMRSNDPKLSSVDNKDLSSVVIPVVSSDPENNRYILSLEQQIEDLKKEKEYWKKKFEEKDILLNEKNEYIQEINTKAFALLGTEEQNRKQTEEIKKSWWQRLTGK